MRITEKLKLKNHPEQKYIGRNAKYKGKVGIISVHSDLEDKKEASTETINFSKSRFFKKWNSKNSPTGLFEWQADDKFWYTTSENFEDAKLAIAAYERIDETVSTLEELEQVLGQIETADFLKETVKNWISDLANIANEEEFNSKMKDYIKSSSKLISALTTYSVDNNILINRARPDAEKVTSQTGWLELGRVPTRGAISIISPRWYWGKDFRGRPRFDQVTPPPEGHQRYKANKYPDKYIKMVVYDVSDTRPATEADYKDKGIDRNTGQPYTFKSDILANNNGDIPNMDDAETSKGDSTQDSWWGEVGDDDARAQKLFGLLRIYAEGMNLNTAGMNITPESGHINPISSKVGNNKCANIIHMIVHEEIHGTNATIGASEEFTQDHQEMQAEMITFSVMTAFKLENVDHHPTYYRVMKNDPKILEKDMRIVEESAASIINELKRIDREQRFANNNN